MALTVTTITNFGGVTYTCTPFNNIALAPGETSVSDVVDIAQESFSAQVSGWAGSGAITLQVLVENNDAESDGVVPSGLANIFTSINEDGTYLFTMPTGVYKRLKVTETSEVASATFTITVAATGKDVGETGGDGLPVDAPVFRGYDGYFQWNNAGVWRNLVKWSQVLIGEIVPADFRVNDGGYIQWSDSDGNWTNLINVSAFKGDTGTPGYSVLNGTAIPTSDIGVDGDFYIKTGTWDVYGPKTGGVWGSSSSMIGPSGEGTGDMLQATYDPTSKNANAFDMAQMTEASNAKVMTAAERTKLAGIEDSADVTDAKKIASAASAVAEKTSLAYTDSVFIIDGEDNDSLKLIPANYLKEDVKAFINAGDPSDMTVKTLTITGDTTTRPGLIFGAIGDGVFFADGSIIAAASDGIHIQVGDDANPFKVYKRDGTFQLELTREYLLHGIKGTVSNLSAWATGASGVVYVTADEILLKRVFTESDGRSAISLSDVSVLVNTAMSGAGGIDTGTIAYNTWYYVYVIYRIGYPVSAIFSLDPVEPLLKDDNYGAYYARVGEFRTAAASYFPLAFKKKGSRTAYTVGGANMPTLPTVASGVSGNVSTPTWSTVPLANYVPPTATKVYGALSIPNGVAAMCAPNSSYGAYNSSANPPLCSGSNTAGVSSVKQFEFLLETAGPHSVYYASNGAARMLIYGWE